MQGFNRNLTTAEKFLQADISSLMGYFWLMGTNSSRKRSSGACKEIASQEFQFAHGTSSHRPHHPAQALRLCHVI
jgi:hypothetical protein